MFAPNVVLGSGLVGRLLEPMLRRRPDAVRVACLVPGPAPTSAAILSARCSASARSREMTSCCCPVTSLRSSPCRSSCSTRSRSL